MLCPILIGHSIYVCITLSATIDYKVMQFSRLTSVIHTYLLSQKLKTISSLVLILKKGNEFALTMSDNILLCSFAEMPTRSYSFALSGVFANWAVCFSAEAEHRWAD